jgi:hypothetical protein
MVRNRRDRLDIIGFFVAVGVLPYCVFLEMAGRYELSDFLIASVARFTPIFVAISIEDCVNKRTVLVYVA